MSRLSWGVVGQRHYETGVDRGVLYVEGQSGVAWSGLSSIKETPSGGTPKSYYFDGVKYLDVAALEEFNATIEAYTYPDEFAQCDGSALAFAGVYVTQQVRRSFGLSYRTLIGNDTDGNSHGYKIHIVYGCLAAPSFRPYSSIGESPEAINFSWDCTTTPVEFPNGLRSSAHVIIDSRKITTQALQQLEDQLYGTDETQSFLPTPEELFAFFTINPGEVFALVLNTVTGLSEIFPEVPGDLQATLEEGLYDVTGDSHLVDGSVDGTYTWEE